MTDTVTPSTPPTAAPPTATPRTLGARSRLRRIVFGSALVLSGAVIGVGSSAISQEYGPHRDWSEQGRAHAWQGPHHGGPHGRMGHGHRFGGAMFGPGSVERMVERLARATDASTEQKQKINAIAQGAASDAMALRERHLAGRQQMRDILAAPIIDRAKLEAVRVEQLKLADVASKRITAAVADAVEVLTPAQRAELARRM
jgi:Spy/CpxP family protein refolding chaperone